MGIGPGLVLRGSFIGIFIVILLTNGIMTGATTSDTASHMETSTDTQVSDAEIVETNSEVPEYNGNGCIVSSNYPAKITQWCELITQYAHRNGLEPDLIAALIWQESGGNKLAYSKSGAVGLMQVMPKDGIAASFMCVNGPCFSNRPSTKELQDPEFNIKYGTKMLAQLLRRNGTLRDALKSYGPMNVGYYYADKVLGIYQRYKD
ncbi:MAG TPA: lytic transglycosylase domain-containing protein [Anaerolineales bacterium]|nr:lytic transglycosylase domain-containing protein [Anaerolineales bacterium]